MLDFSIFRDAVQKQFDKLSATGVLFELDLDKEETWNIYLNSFPEEYNKIHRERLEYDCNCCRHFMRDMAGVVAIIDSKIVSIWDLEVDNEVFQYVAQCLSDYVKHSKIKDVFYHHEKSCGAHHTWSSTELNKKWDHFYVLLNNKCVLKGDRIPTTLNMHRSNKDVFKRTLEELSLNSAETVLELIEQNSIYRGEEHKGIIELFIKTKKEYDSLRSLQEKDNFCWTASIELGGASKIKNTVIGTLLSDISEGVELDKAVAKFESKVAPHNYKRPTALITPKMINQAQETVKELGIEESMKRRHATLDDITINNVIYADRNVKKQMNVFDELVTESKVNIDNLAKVEEVTIEKFLNNILPKAESLEILVENSHENNFVSLIAPDVKDSPNILKWDNNFSWCYKGNVTDSIKERVKAAGGSVTGVFRASLSWSNYDDLDIHLKEPSGEVIYYGNKRSKSGGILDVDENAGSGKTRTPVENITYAKKDGLKKGDYEVIVHNFNRRETSNVGFEIEIEYEGKIFNFYYDQAVRNKGKIPVAIVTIDSNKNATAKGLIPSKSASKEIWGINTCTFHKINVIMTSPNHWDGNKIGNKHWFFMIESCLNPDKVRGLYNEFLMQELNTHRKVFEVLGDKLKAEKSENQLSGLGFSSTKRDSVYLRIKGNFERIVKVVF